MNKFQKELLEKCKKVKIFDEVPDLDDIYILPTNRKHDSGYKILYIIGQDREKNEYFLLDTYCDVVYFRKWNYTVLEQLSKIYKQF